MSNWTHISGSVRLFGPALMKINDRLAFLYPDDQMTLEHVDTTTGTKYVANISALPVIKYKVAKAIDCLPTGEHTVIEHNIYQSDTMYDMSCSDFNAEAEEEQFIRLLSKELHEDIKVDCSKLLHHTRYLSFATLTILDDVRWCDAGEMMKSMITFLKTLYLNDISFGQGYFEWNDWDDKSYAIIISTEQLACVVMDNNRVVLAKKLYHLDYEETGDCRWTPVITDPEEDGDPNWNALVR